MDDSFDELFIPDDWLDMGSKRKNIDDSGFVSEKKMKTQYNSDAKSLKTASEADIDVFSHAKKDDIALFKSENVRSIETDPVFESDASTIEEELLTADGDPIRDFTDGVGEDDPNTDTQNTIPLPIDVASLSSDSSEILSIYGDSSLNEPEFYDTDNINYSTDITSPLNDQSALSETTDKDLNNGGIQNRDDDSKTTENNNSIIEFDANGVEEHAVDVDRFRDNTYSTTQKYIYSKSGIPNAVRELTDSDDDSSDSPEYTHSKSGFPNAVRQRSDDGVNIGRIRFGFGGDVDRIFSTDNGQTGRNTPITQTIDLTANVPEVLASSSTHLGPTGTQNNSSFVGEARIISGIVPGVAFNEILDCLLNHRHRVDRLDIVTVKMLEKSSATSSSSKPMKPVDIFEEVQLVMAAVPHADANRVYTMLESLPPSDNRVDTVILQLNPNWVKESHNKPVPDYKPALLKKDSSIDDPVLKQDVIFCEMRIVAKMFPDWDKNEIYALLEANRYKNNRLEIVVEELTKLGQGDVSQTAATPFDVDDDEENFNFNNAQPNPEHLFEQHVENLRGIFPDCDPNFLYEQLEKIKDRADRLDYLASELFEKRDYPKIKDTENNKSRAEKEQEDLIRKQRVRNLNITVDEFMQRFPEPKKTFEDTSTEKSMLYGDHAIQALCNKFVMLKKGYLVNVLRQHSRHFYVTFKYIASELLKIPLNDRKKHERFMKKPRSGTLPMPAETDEMFYYEFWFALNELNINDHFKQKEEEKRIRLEEAKSKGELYECCCCFDDECFFEDLTGCPEGHLFCKTCLVRSTEAAFGEMKTKFPCLTGECTSDIPLSTLEAVIPAKMFSNILLRIQEEEVLAADIKDLAVCPFCPFATIMPNPDDKVFKCLNPACLKESCRLCQEPNHIPLRCSEVEKKSETNMRTFIENYISEAVMRKCHKCGKRFVKDVGCNMMTCTCKATSCYACKKQNIDYGHFQHNPDCADTDPKRIHKRNMLEAAQKAKEEYLKLHPEASDVELRTDIKTFVKDD